MLTLRSEVRDQQVPFPTLRLRCSALEKGEKCSQTLVSSHASRSGQPAVASLEGQALLGCRGLSCSASSPASCVVESRFPALKVGEKRSYSLSSGLF